VVLDGWRWQSAALARAARRARRDDRIVTVIRLFPWARPHRMRFTEDGVWQQTGGLYGRSERSDPVFRFWRKRGRIRHERTRLSEVRPT
jgi:hypothetical protein